MTTWTSDELQHIGAASELRVTSQRADGTLRPYTTIWLTVLGGTLYIRSAHGPENGWFRRAVQAGTGRVNAGDIERDVTFELADPAVCDELTAALHQKYDRFGPGPIAAITGDDVLQTTLRVLPRD